MGERLRRLKKGAIASLAAIAMSSGAGFCIPSDYNKAAEEARQAYIYEHQDIDGLYDYDNECIPNLEETLQDVRKSTYQIKAYITIMVEGGNEPGLYSLTAMGSGLLLESGHVLTAAHVVSETLDRLTEEDAGGVITLYSVDYALHDGSREYKLLPVWTDDVWTKDEDFALLKFAEEPDSCLPYFHYGIGDAGKLRNGSVTYTFSAVNIPDIKEGNVINNERGCEWGCNENDEYFFEDTRVIAGDSGGPVIAFLDGEPQLVGITCYRHPYENIEGVTVTGGGILKINIALEEAGQFFEEDEE